MLNKVEHESVIDKKRLVTVNCLMQSVMPETKINEQTTG